MTKEQIKAKAKEQFPNDEFKQQIVIDAINWAIKELEHKLEQTEKDLADYQFNYPTIKELEKENAELKKKILSYKDAVDMQMYTNKANKEIANRKLTKAKELLAKWVELFKPKLEGYSITPIQEQTEQFLSEVEK